MRSKRCCEEASEFPSTALISVLATVFASILLAAATLKSATERADALAIRSEQQAVRHALDARARDLADDQRMVMRLLARRMRQGPTSARRGSATGERIAASSGVNQPR